MKISKSYLLLILFGILIVFLYIPNLYQGYHTMEQLKTELQELTVQTKNLKKTKESLTKQVKEFDNLYSIETFARNRLNMKKKDETIYRVIYEEDKN